MLHALLADARFWQFPHRLDEDLAATAGAARCQHCGGVLHRGDYPRKPRGVGRALLVPGQPTPQAPITWQALRLTGTDPLAVRASKKLHNDELLITSFAGTRLRMELDKIPLWRGDHVPVRQLVEDFAKYLYLPRLAEPSVLLEAISSGVASLAWEQDGFAYADSYDELAGRYLGLKVIERLPLREPFSTALVVKADVAKGQLDQKEEEAEEKEEERDQEKEEKEETEKNEKATPTVAALKRFHGSVALDATRVGRDASRIAEEVIAHLESLGSADVRVTLEIDARIPNRAPENVVRIVTEHCRTLKFESQGFEKE